MTTMVKRCEAMMVPLGTGPRAGSRWKSARCPTIPITLMHDQEKLSKELPVTREEMIAYIRAKSDERS